MNFFECKSFSKGNIQFIQGDLKWLDMLGPVLGKVRKYYKGNTTVVAIYDQYAIKFYPLVNQKMLLRFENDRVNSLATMSSNLTPETQYDLPCFVPCYAFLIVNHSLPGLLNQQSDYHLFFPPEDCPFGVKVMQNHQNSMPLPKYIRTCRDLGLTSNLGNEIRAIIVCALVTLHNYHILHPESKLNDFHDSNLLVSNSHISETGEYLHSTPSMEWAHKDTYLRLLTGSSDARGYIHLKMHPLVNGIRVSITDLDESTSFGFFSGHVDDMKHALLGITPIPNPMGPVYDTHLILNSVYLLLQDLKASLTAERRSGNGADNPRYHWVEEVQQFVKAHLHPDVVGFGIPLRPDRDSSMVSITPQHLNLVEGRLSGFAQRLSEDFLRNGVAGIMGAVCFMNRLESLHAMVKSEFATREEKEEAQENIRLITATVLRLNSEERQKLTQGINAESLAVFDYREANSKVDSIYHILKDDCFRNIFTYEDTTNEIMFHSGWRTPKASKLWFWMQNLDREEHLFLPDPFTNQVA